MTHDSISATEIRQACREATLAKIERDDFTRDIAALVLSENCMQCPCLAACWPESCNAVKGPGFDEQSTAGVEYPATPYNLPFAPGDTVRLKGDMNNPSMIVGAFVPAKDEQPEYVTCYWASDGVMHAMSIPLTALERVEAEPNPVATGAYPYSREWLRGALVERDAEIKLLTYLLDEQCTAKDTEIARLLAIEAAARGYFDAPTDYAAKDRLCRLQDALTEGTGTDAANR